MSELVTIKSSHSGIELRLNAELPFPDLLKAVEEKFRQSADFSRMQRWQFHLAEGHFLSAKRSS